MKLSGTIFIAMICVFSCSSRSLAFSAIKSTRNLVKNGGRCMLSSATYGTVAESENGLASIAQTPLGTNGTSLLDGLDVYTVPAHGDEHPLSVYGIYSEHYNDGDQVKKRLPVLLLHGRTWSSVPVYHLLGGPQNKKNGQESRSLMEDLYANGLQPYCMDFRGFGGTPNDSTGYVMPNRCVQDTISVLEWIANRHNSSSTRSESSVDFPALVGWSQGALVAQLVAQKDTSFMSKLVLYGSIYDPMVSYPRDPLYLINEHNITHTLNTFNAAIEDFTIEGTISQEPARIFAEAALVADPVKAVWKHLYEFNNLDPGRVHIPTLVVAGDQDPYAPTRVQQALFSNLGRGSDRTWSIIANADHAVHLLEERKRFVNVVNSFIQNGVRSGNSGD